jgi:hypothetical protein
MEIFRATNNFELANYPLLDGLGVGKVPNFMRFQVQGRWLRLDYQVLLLPRWRERKKLCR